MDPIDMLINGAIQHEVLLNKNPYLTMETMILRLYKQISLKTTVTFNQCDKTILFSEWHDEILKAYQSIKSNVNQEEKAVIERVLSKDCPYPSELTKFACCWYKHDPETVNRWFAVDGIVGNHPKSYVQDAFSTKFAKHNSAVRTLYDYHTDPETIKIIVCTALEIQLPPKEEDYDDPTDLDTCVGIYSEMVGEEEMEQVALDRKSKLQAQQQPKQSNKRSKKQNSEPSEKISEKELSNKSTEETDNKKKLIATHAIKRKINSDKTKLQDEPVKRKKETAKVCHSPLPPFSPCYSPHSPNDDYSPPQSP